MCVDSSLRRCQCGGSLWLQPLSAQLRLQHGDVGLCLLVQLLEFGGLGGHLLDARVEPCMVCTCLQWQRSKVFSEVLQDLVEAIIDECRYPYLGNQLILQVVGPVCDIVSFLTSICTLYVLLWQATYEIRALNPVQIYTYTCILLSITSCV